MTMKYNRVQILRFLAAAVVVMFHSLGTTGKYFPGVTHLTIFGHGDLGVDLFFVISGFIIFITAQTREQSWALFLRRRLERIVPMYWIATLVMFVLMRILYGSSADAPSVLYLLSSLFYVSWIADRLPVIYPGWTLEYEMAFYLLVAVTMSLTVRTWHVVIFVFAGCVAVGALTHAAPATSPVLAFFTNPMYLEFVLGILIGHVVLRQPLPVAPLVAAAVALIVILAQPWTEYSWRLIVAGVPASLIVAGAALLDGRSVPLSRVGHVLARFGDASYSIYLVQVIVISILCKALHFAAPHLSHDAAIVLVAGATLVCAFGVHHVLERPIGRYFHRIDRGGSTPRSGYAATAR